MRKSAYITTSFFIFSLVYAILRYNIFGPVGWEQIPVYVLNKAIALTSIFCISLSVIYKRNSQEPFLKKYFGLQGFFLATFHIILSLAILNQKYYPSMYIEEGTFSFMGNIIILFGVMGWMLFLTASVYSLPFFKEPLKYIRIYVLLGSFAIVVHILVKGWGSWIIYPKWYGYMLPISLLSFILIGISISYHLCFSRKNE